MTETFVLVHGAWRGGWCWSRVARLLREARAGRSSTWLAPTPVHPPIAGGHAIVRRELAAGHNAMISAPAETTAVLLQ